MASSLDKSLFFGGIEGGATHSKLIICDKNGQIIATVQGPSTNHWLCGMSECARRIADMVNQGKEMANIPLAQKLKSLGLSLSGCSQSSSNNALENEIKTKYPNVSESFVICDDTIGSVFTASPLGGLVLIAGTGSNAFLSNPDGKTYNCGGWGHMLGDEGGGWYMSYKAIKIVFDHMDNLEQSKYPISRTWELIKSHFNIESRSDLLEHCYTKFQKPFFAELCSKLAVAATDGDPLCIHIFEDAGRSLAKATLALLPKVSEELVKSGDLSIVCVGSVWQSWSLLKNGFIREISRESFPFGLKLLKLIQHMALGAVYIGVDAINYDMQRDYSKNYEVFHYYHQKAQKNGNGNSEEATICA